MSERICEECDKTCETRRGGFRYNHFLCNRCSRKSNLPKLFAKTHPDYDKWKDKHNELRRVKGFRNITWDEKRYLWIKHIKKGESAEEATAAMKNLVSMVRNHAYAPKVKPDFKKDFSELTKRGKR